MSPKSSALDLLMQARDQWAIGENDHAVDLLDAANGVLVEAGHSEKSMPTTFDLIKRIRSAIVGESAA